MKALVREGIDKELVVACERDRAPAIAIFREQCQQLGERAAVLAERRLVEDERAGRGRESGPDRETPLLSAREGEWLRSRDLRGTEPRQQPAHPDLEPAGRPADP